MQYTITLKAGIPNRQEVIGTNLVVLDTGAAPYIDLKVEIAKFAAEEFRGIKRGFNLKGPGFTSVLVTSLIDTKLELITSFADITINYQDGGNINATLVGTPTVLIGAQPVSVVPDRGAPANPVYVSGITYADAPAASLTNAQAIAVGPAEIVVMAYRETRKAARFLNLGPDPVTIGAAGITWTQRTIVLNVGDLWVEDRAANVAWSAITDEGKSASVTVQGVIA